MRNKGSLATELSGTSAFQQTEEFGTSQIFLSGCCRSLTSRLRTIGAALQRSAIADDRRVVLDAGIAFNGISEVSNNKRIVYKVCLESVFLETDFRLIERFLRYWEGLIPITWRKTVLKCAWLAKPELIAMSVRPSSL
jgi:hypothetical protein